MFFEFKGSEFLDLERLETPRSLFTEENTGMVKVFIYQYPKSSQTLMCKELDLTRRNGQADFEKRTANAKILLSSCANSH